MSPRKSHAELALAFGAIKLPSLFLARRIERLPRPIRDDILTQIDEAQPAKGHKRKGGAK